MSFERHEIKELFGKAFSSDSMSLANVKQVLSGLDLAAEDTVSDVVIYELAQVHSLAGFLVLNQGFQKRLHKWVKAHCKDLNDIPEFCSVTSIYPRLDQSSSILFLKEGRASILDFKTLNRDVQPLAFRDVDWYFLKHSEILFSYDTQILKTFLLAELGGIAALVAGIKRRLFNQAVLYSRNRVQGGRSIVRWTEVQKTLSQLYLQVKRDEKHILDLSPASALDVIGESDAFVSSAMQVFGGAGYVEDYGAEKSFRECVFLKNWIMPFKETQLQLFSDEVLGE